MAADRRAAPAPQQHPAQPGHPPGGRQACVKAASDAQACSGRLAILVVAVMHLHYSIPAAPARPVMYQASARPLG